jgi:hypothetical protein
MGVRTNRFGIPQRQLQRNNRALLGCALFLCAYKLIDIGDIFKKAALETVGTQIAGAVNSTSPDDPCNTQYIKNVKIPLKVPYALGLVSINVTAVNREQSLTSRTKKVGEKQPNQGELFELYTTDVTIFSGINFPYRHKDRYYYRCTAKFTSKLS